MPSRTYSDAQLAEAMRGARSWRGVLRNLGLVATSSSAIRSVKDQADRLGLDHSHFTGQRRWSESQLEVAIIKCRSWTAVASELGLAIGSSTTALKGHAARLGLNTAHLSGPPARIGDDPPTPRLSRLPRAGSMLAAAWFAMCGYEVAWPLEPCPYDLIAQRDREVLRIQVKTTRLEVAGAWKVQILSECHPEPYDPSDIDYFFIVDGDLAYYLIPVAAVGGLQGLVLRSYEGYRVQRFPEL